MLLASISTQLSPLALIPSLMLTLLSFRIRMVVNERRCCYVGDMMASASRLVGGVLY